MDKARYLRRGALLSFLLAIFVFAFAAVNVGAGNMIPGVPPDAFSLTLIAALLVWSAAANKFW